MYKLILPKYYDDETREEKKDRFYKHLRQYYSKLENLTEEEYFELKSRFDSGDNAAMKELFYKSLNVVAKAVSHFYSRYDITNFLPVEDAMAISIYKLNGYLDNFTELPAYFSQYKHSTINYNVFTIISREYEILVKKYGYFDYVSNGEIKYITDKKESYNDPDGNLVIEEFRKCMKIIEKKLNDTEIRVLKMKCGFDNCKPMSLIEIAQVLNVTKARVHQIEANAIKKIRNCNKAKVLHDFIDINTGF